MTAVLRPLMIARVTSEDDMRALCSARVLGVSALRWVRDMILYATLVASVLGLVEAVMDALRGVQ